jgi:SAM-dependent methyltransferase
MSWLQNQLRPLDAADYTARLIRQGACRLCLDIGCGNASPLSALRPGIVTVGLDAFEASIKQARARNLHDQYVVADILKTTPDEIRTAAGVESFDLVALYDVIEHLPKRKGFELLELCETLSGRYVVVQTPNGFLEQGPEFGNPYQRHLSGWFGHDFEGMGYHVRGISGTRYCHGYAGQFRWPLPGMRLLDVLLTHLLRAQRHYCHAFNLFAWKDVRGVPPRLGS